MILDFLKSKKWRLNNLYRIIDKKGDSIAFELNDVQSQVLENIHSRNLILKARQLGMSTFSVLYLLDEAIFNENTSAGIVSYSLEHAQHIFKRIIGHALDSMTDVGKQLCGTIQRSAREISFSNGSYLRVDTTLRGGAYQLVLVSEFGKTCARNPVKAEEVMTGTLQSVPSTGRIIIESTGEGNSGFYADMVNHAAQIENKELNDLDYKLFFFPWYVEKGYILKSEVEYPVELTDYFDDLEEKEHTLITKEQRNWYAHQKGILGDKIRQEFPSTVSESFLSSSDAYYFQGCLEKAHIENRCLSISVYDCMQPVYVGMDIGVNDLTVMIFFQLVHGEIRILDFYEDNGKGLDFYSHFLQQEKKYLYHTIFLPHDAKKRDGIIVENTYEREFKRLFSNTDTRFIILKKTDKNINITNAKIKFDRCVFDMKKTGSLLNMISKYRKKWSEQYGKYLDEPFHDLSSHYASSYIYCMQAVSHLETHVGKDRYLDKHKKITENRKFKV